MNEPREQAADSSVDERMVARIEVNDIEDPAGQSKIVNAVMALDGVTESKIEKGALHVSYDPLDTTEAKIEQAVHSTGNTIKSAATETAAPHPDLPRSSSEREATSKGAQHS
jgi:copper chaperone CopZ